MRRAGRATGEPTMFGKSLMLCEIFGRGRRRRLAGVITLRDMMKLLELHVDLDASDNGKART